MNTSHPQNPGQDDIMGSLLTEGALGVVRIEVHLHRSVDEVWSAIAEKSSRVRWLGDFEGELRAGGNFSARFAASEWHGKGRIEMCEPGRRLLVSLTESESLETHFMEVNLRLEESQTVLVVEERGIALDQLAAYGAGVQIHVEDLVAYLSGGQRCDASARWKELISLYRAKPINARA